MQLQREERCARDLGASRPFSVAASGIRTPSPDPFVPVADRLGPSNWWAQVEDVPLIGGTESTDRLTVSLLVRGGALDNIEVLEPGTGPGVWLSDRASELMGLHAGDFATIGETRVGIAGVYRDLSGPSVDDFWCSNADMLLLEGPELIPPPPLVLVDRETLASVMQDFELPAARGAWQAGLRPGLTLHQADELLGSLTCRDGDDRLSWCASGVRPPVPGTPSGPFRDQSVDARDEAEFATRFLESSLPFAIARTRAIQKSVGGGIWAIAALATLAGLGLVAATAALWLDRRRREVTLLAVRGVSPAAVGAKAVLEVAVPLVVGVAAGVLAAYALVAWLGPSPHVEVVCHPRGVPRRTARHRGRGRHRLGGGRDPLGRRPLAAPRSGLARPPPLGAAPRVAHPRLLPAPRRVGRPHRGWGGGEPGGSVGAALPGALPPHGGRGRGARPRAGDPARPSRQPSVADRAVPGCAARGPLPGRRDRPRRRLGHRGRRPRLRRDHEPLARDDPARQGPHLRRQRRGAPPLNRPAGVGPAHANGRPRCASSVAPGCSRTPARASR